MLLLEDLFVKEHLIGAATFAIFSAISNRLASKYGFFKLPPEEDRKIPLRFLHVFAAFAIYLGVSIFLIPLVARGMMSFTTHQYLPFKEIARLQLLSLLMSLIALFAYLFTFSKKTRRRIWKDDEYATSSFPKDMLVAIGTWFIAFPVVVFVGQTLDLLLYIFFGVQGYEQVAVSFLKLALSTPNTFLIALFTVLVGAPLIEELLFRGFLQTYLKNKMGRKAAIAISSLAFAFFHMSPSQGYGNISLLFSLFIFGLYLGYIYERQRSLIASMVLHSMFNLVSALRILTLME